MANPYKGASEMAKVTRIPIPQPVHRYVIELSQEEANALASVTRKGICGQDGGPRRQLCDMGNQLVYAGAQPSDAYLARYKNHEPGKVYMADDWPNGSPE